MTTDYHRTDNNVTLDEALRTVVAKELPGLEIVSYVDTGDHIVTITFANALFQSATAILTGDQDASPQEVYTYMKRPEKHKNTYDTPDNCLYVKLVFLTTHDGRVWVLDGHTPAFIEANRE